MVIDGYSFANMKSFPGKEFPAYSFTIARNDRRFAEFIDHGDGSEPELRPMIRIDNDRANRYNESLTEELRRYAEEHAPMYPGDPGCGIESHKGDMLLFMAVMADWLETEQRCRRFTTKRYMGMKAVGVLLDNSAPRDIIMLPKPNIRLTAKRLLNGIEDTENLSITVLELPPWNFRCGFPKGSPASSFLEG